MGSFAWRAGTKRTHLRHQHNAARTVGIRGFAAMFGPVMSSKLLPPGLEAKIVGTKRSPFAATILRSPDDARQ